MHSDPTQWGVRIDRNRRFPRLEYSGAKGLWNLAASRLRKGVSTLRGKHSLRLQAAAFKVPAFTLTCASCTQIVVMDNGCMCCTIRGDLLSGCALLCYCCSSYRCCCCNIAATTAAAAAAAAAPNTIMTTQHICVKPVSMVVMRLFRHCRQRDDIYHARDNNYSIRYRMVITTN